MSFFKFPTRYLYVYMVTSMYRCIKYYLVTKDILLIIGIISDMFCTVKIASFQIFSEREAWWHVVYCILFSFMQNKITDSRPSKCSIFLRCFAFLLKMHMHLQIKNAIQLLENGHFLFTCTCHYHVLMYGNSDCMIRFTTLILF